MGGAGAAVDGRFGSDYGAVDPYRDPRFDAVPSVVGPVAAVPGPVGIDPRLGNVPATRDPRLASAAALDPRLAGAPAAAPVADPRWVP